MNEQRTVKVRIAVAVDPRGDWNATGWFTGRQVGEKEMMDAAAELVGDGEARYWIEAELPIPAPLTMQGNVTPAE